MKKITLVREYKKEATLGAMLLNEKEICLTIERPKYFNGKENQRDSKNTKENESCCIPEGLYKVVWSYSPSFKRNTYEILEVEGRSGIRIHRANTVDQLLGCIAPVSKITDKNPSNNPKIPYYKKWFGYSSKKAENILLEAAEKEGFELLITSTESDFLEKKTTIKEKNKINKLFNCLKKILNNLINNYKMR